MAIFDFESICVEDEDSKETKTTTRIGKCLQISVLISTSNFIQEPISLCNANSCRLVSSFIDALEKLHSQSETQMNMNCPQIEATIKNWLAGILEVLNQRRSWGVRNEAEDDIPENSSREFLQRQSNQLIEL